MQDSHYKSPLILSKGEKAIIYKSMNCKCVNITLPNISLHINEDGMMELTNAIKMKLDMSCNDCEKIFIETPASGITLRFNVEELRELLNLLLSAKLNLELIDVTMDY